MADTGWITAGSGAVVSLGGTYSWGNPGNITADDTNNTSCTAAAAGQSQGIRAYNFGISLPTGAHIDGVEVRLGDIAKTSGLNAVSPDTLRLVDDSATIVGDNRNTDLSAQISTTPANEDGGGASILWGVNLTKAMVEDADFGFVFGCAFQAANSCLIDFMQIKVYYHVGLPVSVTTLTQSSFFDNIVNGPFKATNGNFYAVIWHQDSNAERISIYKATDPTSSWSLVTNADLSLAPPDSFTAIIDGNDIHVASLVAGTGGTVRHGVFNVSSETWTTSVAGIGTTTIDSTTFYPQVDLIVRADGAIVIVYTGATDSVKGDDKQRVDRAHWNGSSWNVVDGALDAGNDVHYGNPTVCVDGNDDTHFIWQRHTGTTDDPPVNWQDTQGRTLDAGSATTVSSVMTASSPNTVFSMRGFRKAIATQYSGTWYAHVPYARDNVSGANNASGGVDRYTISSNIITNTYNRVLVANDVQYLFDQQGPFAIAANGTDLYAVYGGGGNDGVDQDLYWSKSTDNGANWSTPVELQDGVTVTRCSCNVYTRGAATVLGIIYCEQTSTTPTFTEAWRYHEYVIDAGAVTASGNATAPTTTASGTATLGALEASGNVNAPETTASGTAAVTNNIRTASGNANAPETTASGAARILRRAQGAVTAAAVTALGVATLGALTATGNVTAAEATATGTAGYQLQASGNVTAPTTTASGTATLGALTASGNVDAPAAESSGTADLGALEASGNITFDQTTASGTAAKKIAASGTPNAPTTTASGTAAYAAGATLTASGTPDAPTSTATGTAGMLQQAAGTADAPTTTASGTAALGALDASGNPNTPTSTATGTAALKIAASGTADAPTATSTGTATLGALTASGALDAAAATASGTAAKKIAASGSLDAPTTTATGVATVGGMAAYGSPNAPTATASGTAAAVSDTNASGTPDAPTTTATGTATLGALTASGNAAPDAATASGAAQVISATSANGTPEAPTATASGTATLGALVASGNVTAPITTASGAVGRLADASGTPDAPTTTANGVAGLLGNVAAVGNAVTPTTEASGTATLGAIAASGNATTPEVTASGTADFGALEASGNVDVTAATASGTATLGALAAFGAPNLAETTASGTASLGPITADGAANTPTTSATGVATSFVQGVLPASGTPLVAAATASGTASLGPLEASGSVEAPTTTASGTAAGPIPDVGGGGGSMGYFPSKFRRPLSKLSLRTQPIKDEEIEEQIEAIVEETIDEVESVERQTEDTTVPGQDIARIAAKRAITKQELIRGTRKAEKVSQRLAEAQIKARINELVRQRRKFFESDDEDLQAILFILSELL